MSAHRATALYRWTDADGAALPLLCRVEQVRVCPQEGALASRLRHQGHVVGWDTTWLHVCFEPDHAFVVLQAHLVRALTPRSAAAAPMKADVAPTTTWLELRDAALAATRRGWPVTPGTYLGTDRRWHGRDNAQTLGPINDTWADAPVTDPAQAWDTWTHAPYGVLLVCGRVVAVLDLPVTLVGLLTPTEALFPVVATSQSRLLAITKADPETTLSPRLAEAGVRLYGASRAPAWVALPPTTTGLVLFQRWFTSPAKDQTRLPPAAWVQQALLTALRDTMATR